MTGDEIRNHPPRPGGPKLVRLLEALAEARGMRLQSLLNLLP
jgi:hypothetical protein